MKDTIEVQGEHSEQLKNFLDTLLVLSKIDFQKFPKPTNKERFERVSKMFNDLSPKDKQSCMYEYSVFLEGIGRRIPSDVSQAVKDIVGSLVQENIFAKYRDFNSLRLYIESLEGEIQWSESKLNMFLQHIVSLGKSLSYEDKKIIFTMLFHKSAFRGCPWNNQNINTFASILSPIRSDVRVHMRELFLSLPNIKRIPELERVGTSWNTILSGPQYGIIQGRGPRSNFGMDNWATVISR